MPQKLIKAQMSQNQILQGKFFLKYKNSYFYFKIMFKISQKLIKAQMSEYKLLKGNFFFYIEVDIYIPES